MDIRRRGWHAGLTCGRTAKAHAYQLLRTICGTAVVDDLIPSNPCQIRGAGSTKRARKVTVATAAEVATLTAAMPPRLRLMVLLAAYAGPRFGEMASYAAAISTPRTACCAFAEASSG